MSVCSNWSWEDCLKRAVLPVTGFNPLGWFDDISAKGVADAFGVHVTIFDVTTKADEPLQWPASEQLKETHCALKLLKCDVHFDL